MEILPEQVYNPHTMLLCESLLSLSNLTFLLQNLLHFHWLMQTVPPRSVEIKYKWRWHGRFIQRLK